MTGKIAFPTLLINLALVLACFDVSAARADPLLKLGESRWEEARELGFLIDGDGRVYEGERAAENEPVDHSALFGEEFLSDLFLISGGACWRHALSCLPMQAGWSSELKLKVIYEAGSLDVDDFQNVADVGDAVLLPFKAEIVAEKDISKAHVVLFSGSTDFLKEKAKHNLPSKQYDIFIKERFRIEEAASQSGFLARAQRYLTGSRGKETCQIQRFDRNGVFQTFLFLPSENLIRCIPKYVYMSLGFVELSDLTPSVLNEDFLFSVPTQFDRAAAATLNNFHVNEDWRADELKGDFVKNFQIIMHPISENLK